MIQKTIKNNIHIYHVDKCIPDEECSLLKNKYVTSDLISLIIDHDADVYTTDGKLLIRFRKHKLPEKKIDTFYKNVIPFAMKTTNNRGSACGSKSKNVKHNPKIRTNIIGYFDSFSPMQKLFLRNAKKNILSVRESRFNMWYPEKFRQLLPLIRTIDQLYKSLLPECYRLQIKKAKQTPFRIANTSFTTITTNVNFQTTIHKDKGDDIEGFGNLVVIENGRYKGGETCLPQYGVGVNVRSGDILFMDVHEWHGNLPIYPETPDAKRLSIVCYLRIKIWEKTKHMTRKQMLKHNKLFRYISLQKTRRRKSRK